MSNTISSAAPAAPAPPGGFLGGFRAAWASVFAYVLFGTYVGVGALAHDFGFSASWLAVSTVLVWAAPAQVILISTLGSGASLVEIAIAVTLSAVRLLPMVVALLPMVRAAGTRRPRLMLVAHFTAISMWVESLRLVPAMPREQRAGFCIGLGAGFMVSALAAGTLGFYLAASLPVLLGAALLFLTPLSFLLSVVRNSRTLVEQLAFGLGFVVGPLLAAASVDLDLLWTGIIGGTVAYGVHWWRGSRS